MESDFLDDQCIIDPGRPQYLFKVQDAIPGYQRRSTKAGHHSIRKAHRLDKISPFTAAAAQEWVPGVDDINRYVLSGRVEHLPRRNPKVVRIFLSSTFTDMSVERNALFKNAYPRLQSYCRERWDMDFHVVDMRWGVLSGATNDHSGVQLCMAELKVCQEESLGPNFVLLLGQRYGARPLPSAIGDVEFHMLVGALKHMSTPESDVEFLQAWYLCDNNALPPLRLLQPLDVMGVEQQEYAEMIEPRLRRILRTAADECNRVKMLDDTAHHRYFWSVTEEEVFNGILNVQNPSDHCLCFTRYITDIDFKNVKVGRFVDVLDDGGIDEEAQDLRDAMQRHVYHVLNEENITEFTVPWSDNGGINDEFHEEYLRDLCNSFYKKVIDMIDRAAFKDKLQLMIAQSSLLTEVAEHGYEAKEKCAAVSCHSVLKEQIMNYVNDDVNTPFIVYGESGFGKTSLMAMASVNASLWNDGQADVLVVRRFLGITTDSTYIEPLLRSISDQVAAYWNISLPVVDDPLLLFDLLLPCIPKGARLVIFLDSLDRLSAIGKAHALGWLPSVLPPKVKVVVSCLPSECGILDTLQARSYPPTSYVHVKVLDVTASLNLLIGWLGSEKRKLSDEQLQVITTRINSSSQTSPLYVKLMFNILKATPSYMSAELFTRRFENLSRPKECIQHIIGELRIKHGYCLVDSAFGFLHLANQGLTENEIVHLLSLDDVVLNDVFQFHMPPLRRLPAVLWTRIRHDVSEYVVERDIAGAKVLGWFDRQFTEVAQQNFIDYCSAHRIKELQLTMVDYFMGTWANGKQKPFTYSSNMVKKLQLSSGCGYADRFVPEQPNLLSNNKPNMRKLSQLPSLLVATGKLDTFLAEILGSIEVLRSMFEVYTWMEISNVLDDLQNKGLDELSKFAYAVLWKCLHLCCATATLCPAALAPLLAGRLLPLYGSAAIIDRLLDDIYSKGVEHNALVVRHHQLEGFGSYLLFEITNHHQGPCQGIREVCHNSNSYIMSVSKTAALIDMQNGNISMQFSPKFRDGDHFKILTSADGDSPEFIAASLCNVPKVYVFSVKRQECTGHFDCRRVGGFDEFLIYDMLAFCAAAVEIVAIWGSGLHGILLYGLRDCELLFSYSNACRVLTAVHAGTVLHLIQAGQVLQLSVHCHGSNKVQVTETTKIVIPFPSSILITAKHYSVTSRLVALAASDGKLFLWTNGSPCSSRTVLETAAHRLTIKDRELIACTRNYVYALTVDNEQSKPLVKWRIRKRLDFAGYAWGSELVGYRFGSITILELTSSGSRVEVYEHLTFAGHAKQITDIIINEKSSLQFMTSSADGTIRQFNPDRHINPHIVEMSKFDRMEVRINALYGSGPYALTIAKDNRIVAVWSLATGKILHRLFHDGSGDLRDAIVVGTCVVTADAGGIVYVWNLDKNRSHPAAEITVPGFHTMVAKSGSELIILSRQSVLELGLPSGTVVVTKPLMLSGAILHSCWCPNGLVCACGPDFLTLNLISDGTYAHQQLLTDVSCLEQFGLQVSGLHCYGSILALVFAGDIVFYNIENNYVLTSVPVKRPVLLKSHSSIVATRSGPNVQFFDMSSGITKMGCLKLTSTKDTAVLSPDGRHCLVVKRPKLLQLFRISDLSEVGVYSCYSDILCATITSDSKHVLVGMSDTRLLSFLIVDTKLQGQFDRLQGILCKPSSSEEHHKKVLMLAAVAGQDDRAEAAVLSSYAEAACGCTDCSAASTGDKEPFSRQININGIKIDKGGEDKLRKDLTYARHIVSVTWRHCFSDICNIGLKTVQEISIQHTPAN